MNENTEMGKTKTCWSKKILKFGCALKLLASERLDGLLKQKNARRRFYDGRLKTAKRWSGGASVIIAAC